jgi:hypothetical protein
MSTSMTHSIDGYMNCYEVEMGCRHTHEQTWEWCTKPQDKTLKFKRDGAGAIASTKWGQTCYLISCKMGFNNGFLKVARPANA